MTPLSEGITEDCRRSLRGREAGLEALKGDTILITGGTGFAGCWLAETLCLLNDDLRFGVKLILLARGAENFRRLRPHLARRKDVQLMAADVRSSLDLPPDIGWVIHAAANPDNRQHATSPADTMSTIGEGTMSVVRALDRCSNLKRFLNLSSGLIYGPQPQDLPQIPESWAAPVPCDSAQSAYAEAKRFAEAYCAAARSQQRLPAVNARLFSFLGPYQSLDTPWAINNFLRDALSGSAIRVLGDGQTVRSYLYGSDLAVWLLTILVRGEVGRSYNVGSPEPVTLEKLARLISVRFNPPPEIRLNASGGAHRRTVFVPDVSLAMRELGLSITVPLETALERTIQWNKASPTLPALPARS